MTFDIENVSVPILESLESVAPVLPGPFVVAQAQDRLLEKRLFERLGIPTARYVVIDGPEDIAAVEEALAWPIVVKARRLGYDGRGQRIVRSTSELAAAWEALGSCSAIAEGWVDFECEVSLIGARGRRDELVFYPLSENRHRDGMLESTIAPFTDARLENEARSWMTAMMRDTGYVGVLTIEFFVADGELIANEIAPRVHNSGHWTIEGAETSQFENHVRAVLGLPLGSTRMRGTALMRNLIGEMPPRDSLLAIDGLHLHDYGKTPRPGRKIGHCTLLASNREAAGERLRSLETVLGQPIS